MADGRMFQIVYLLLERQQLTVAQLARRFEVSTRTIQRDIDALSAAGIPVYALRGRGGGVRLLPGFVLDKSLLSPREQDEILFALQSLKATGAGGNEEIISRLAGLFRREQVDWIHVDFSGWGDSDAERQAFERIKEAILGRGVLAFDYYASNGTGSARTAEPVRLNYQGNGWYLQAWCRGRRDWRTFRVSRMEHLRLTGETFEARAEQPPPMMAGEEFSTRLLTLRFSPQVAYRVYDEFDRRKVEKQPDGSLVLSVHWPTGSWGHGYLLSFGEHVEILAPFDARAEMREVIENLLKVYDK